MKILVVEDDGDTLSYVTRGLGQLGHTVDAVADGREGCDRAMRGIYDVIVLDRMLPELDGVSILKNIRVAGIKAPVLFLTAIDGINDRVAGLDAGADDYLVKPFAFSELAARVHALGRRPALTNVETVLKVADLEMDLRRHMVKRDGKVVELQPREFKLLEYLMRNAGQVVTRTMLLEHVWDFHFDPRTKIIETHMSRLRSKIESGTGVPLIHTVRGAGYSLHEPE
ncbi:MAG: response regulator [Alphaproteobacteria bacterium]|nr:response regulator [Alphaproteobacteria bacterium]